jgi:hypothetical protein
MNKHHLIGFIVINSASITIFSFTFDISHAQTNINGNNSTGQSFASTNGTFASALDLFVVPDSIGGYGVYEE